MSLIEWSDDFAIGLDAVDHEHRELIALINGLHRSLAEDAPRAEIERVLGEIESGIGAHFALEEKTMLDLNYDGYRAHKADHESLLDDIRDISDAYDEGAYEEMSGLLSEHLRKWFSVHFREMDARLHRFLEARPA